PHQAAQAALQRHAARRQELSLSVHFDAPGVSADQFLSRQSQAARPVLRALPECPRHARDLAAAAETLSAAPLQRFVLRQSLAALSAIPDQALLRALCAPD